MSRYRITHAISSEDLGTYSAISVGGALDDLATAQGYRNFRDAEDHGDWERDALRVELVAR